MATRPASPAPARTRAAAAPKSAAPVDKTGEDAAAIVDDAAEHTDPPAADEAEETELIETADADPAPADDAEPASPLVTVVLREGEMFGLGKKQFVKNVPVRVTQEVADILSTKMASATRVRPGQAASKDLIPRFEIVGQPRTRARAR